MTHGTFTAEDTDPTHPSSTAQTAPESILRRPGELTLRVLNGGADASQLVTIAKTRIVVGRSRTADLILNHSSVSGVHFELRIGSHGIELRDLQSRNGVRVGRMVVFHAIIGPGAVISAGDCEVQIAGIGDVDVPVSAEGRLGAMLGTSATMRELFAQIRRLAKTPLDALVVGETGTGKELVSRALHSLSSRADRPFVTLDCTTLSRSLVEAALFGYRRGAFTDADHDSPGFVENATGGTLFIDEIGELPLDLQVKLLRVLDRREVVRLGETHPRTVDIKVIAATNRDLEKMVSEGQFREDLFFRLSRARLELPPLRERGDDTIELARHFANEVGHEKGVALAFSVAAERLLRNHTWKGNVRELRDVVRVAAHFADREEIGAGDIMLGSNAATQQMSRLLEMPYRQAHMEFDRTYLNNALRITKGSMAACARMLRMSRTTLRRRLVTLGIVSAQ
jgi:DNA-binding NtrC family response regulator